ncbi:MAG TPA: hypothetical protein VLF41_02785 [Candidatus Nanoarchaeia archaeon]|nr:hypothetical protein [Candidatus Nanoarchaeia archaeon]
MLQRMKIKVMQIARPEPVRLRVKAFRPEPPLGFVPRTDPNFYFLSRR